jgi:hypothetical protein
MTTNLNIVGTFKNLVTGSSDRKQIIQGQSVSRPPRVPINQAK